MVQCERCHREFPFQWKLDRHLARKFPCKEVKTHIVEAIPQIKDECSQIKDECPQNKQYNCQYCNKEFNRVDNKNRHENSCILQEDCVRDLEIKLGIELPVFSNTKCRFCLNEYNWLSKHTPVCKSKKDYKLQLEKQLEEKHARAVGGTTTAHTINNTTNNNNTKINDHSTTNNITQYITVNPFGKENMEYITREVILKLCRKANFRDEIIPRLVKQVHCNPDHPENHNLLITNLRAAHGTVYDGENYIAETSKDIIDKVMDNVTDHLTTAAYMDNDDGKFNPYERAITRLEEDIGDEDSKFKREQRTKVKRNIYNNQKILQKTRRTVEAQE